MLKGCKGFADAAAKSDANRDNAYVEFYVSMIMQTWGNMMLDIMEDAIETQDPYVMTAFFEKFSEKMRAQASVAERQLIDYAKTMIDFDRVRKIPHETPEWRHSS